MYNPKLSSKEEEKIVREIKLKAKELFELLIKAREKGKFFTLCFHWRDFQCEEKFFDEKPNDAL